MTPNWEREVPFATRLIVAVQPRHSAVTLRAEQNRDLIGFDHEKGRYRDLADARLATARDPYAQTR
jgi:hypothetical protein